MENAFDKLKNIQKSNSPKQKVVQVKESKRDNEKSYMLWLNKDLLKDLKKRAIEEDSNMKEIIEKALNQYLNK
ncbi:ribbon-helix-helix protein, CopG family [Empedobacter falsenii]|uniref:ribbon-helix-helix protein, CopG family n=1 Tax=Empedobacter stercoris TaxID=1628248 RepID=UPI001CE09D2A|nr:ribbon-helix-helix protein, CopG family [Empedobacter stercoris]MCA4783325.1 ribbon-helix-helix protein, CopG family [Empedobacter stercoris]